jgi:acyl-lipid omega-6 desaturase (Delta-12 desaturase)
MSVKNPPFAYPAEAQAVVLDGSEQEIVAAFGNWGGIVKPYIAYNNGKAAWQIIESFGLFLLTWAVMYYSLSISYWLTLALSVFNAFMLVKIFIIQHDCGHNSFVQSNIAKTIIGNICSVFSLIPYGFWAKTHNFHHGHNGILENDVRDIGDLDFLTVAEYEALGKWQRIGYQIYRSPFVLFCIVPIYYIFIHGRIMMIKFKGWEKEHISVGISNLLMLLVVAGMMYLVGWKAFLLVQMPIWILFGIIAIWFFYVQHQHEQSYKAWKGEWQYVLAAIKGSTFYKLPRVFHWLTGNIGYHHIHHLSSKIPNYNLVKCHEDNPIFEKYVYAMTFTESLKCMFNKLWDEDEQRMITFKEFYARQR